jgi:hypothetical protein
MAETISIQDVAKELNTYVKNNTTVVPAGVYSEDITLNRHTRPLTAVKGKYPQFHSILSDVVQGFKAEWQALGQAQFKHKMLQNFHQKVNYPVTPSEILHSWLAELYAENKKPADMPISQWIMMDLMKKVVDNLEDLSQMAEYDADNAAGQYGYSMDGIAKKVNDALADATHPAFNVPVRVWEPGVNTLDVIKDYEKGLPKKTRRKIRKIFVSDAFALDFQDLYEKHYGTKVTFTDADSFRTPLMKFEIVALPFIPDAMIFATIDSNFVRLIDVFDRPTVTDIQIQDYTVKIFMEFWLGYDFLINQLLYVAVYDDGERGLRNAAQNALYYNAENLTEGSESE